MSTMDKDREDAGHEYFSRLYGATSVEGEPQQTIFDKWRDNLLVNTYRKYSTSKLADSDVLDVGCGYGWLLDAFEGAHSLCGVDIAHHAVDVAAKRKPERFFKQGDLHQPSPFSEKFDLILAINIIEHLSDPEAGIRSIRDSAKPGAIVLVHMPTISNWLTRWNTPSSTIQTQRTSTDHPAKLYASYLRRMALKLCEILTCHTSQHFSPRCGRFIRHTLQSFERVPKTFIV
jgi:2-polyprenyl-3-methyl-5-hydroxy-6-metoxy-1,4-benzoquinol methylase